MSIEVVLNKTIQIKQNYGSILFLIFLVVFLNSRKLSSISWNMTTITLKKISQVLGLSISTVSRALKDHPDISVKTKQRVMDLAKTLDYEPNANAINLRTSKSKIFGLIVPHISNYFYESFISAVEEESRLHGYSLMILQSGDDPQIEMDNFKLCRQNRVMGLFICISPKTKDIEHFIRFSEFNTPVVFFDKVPSNLLCNKVCFADADAAIIAAKKIIQKKKKNVLAIFGDKDHSITQKREAAFKSEFQNKNDDTKLIIEHVSSAEEARNVCYKYCRSKNKPDTVFCMSDETLTGVMKTLQEMHLKVPNDIAVIAISNGFFPKLFFPEITYIETNGYKLGKLAFGKMLACLAGETTTSELIQESLLVEGGSI